MKKRFLIAWLAGRMVVSSGGLAGAREILWVHQSFNNAGDPAVEDQGFLDLLTTNGHVVTRDEGRYQEFGQENDKHSDALNTGVAHDATLGDIQSLVWFQAIPNGKCRLNTDRFSTEQVKSIFHEKMFFNCLASWDDGCVLRGTGGGSRDYLGA